MSDRVHQRYSLTRVCAKGKNLFQLILAPSLSHNAEVYLCVTERGGDQELAQQGLNLKASHLLVQQKSHYFCECL